MKRYFITGTDTEVGKTTITISLLQASRCLGFTTLGLKPLASGCQNTKAGLRNEDARRLQRESTIQLPYEQINPVSLQDSVAPDIAARRVGRLLCVNELVAGMQPALSSQADLTVIEGIGGWHVPLNRMETMADFVKVLNVPVIMIVGLRLGCLNHAILTAQAICASGLHLCGWVANCICPSTDAIDENIVTLTGCLDAPLLGVVQYQQDPMSIFTHSVIKWLLAPKPHLRHS